MPVGTATALSVAGSVAGGLLNKGKNTQTSQTTPVLPAEYQQGFTDLLTRAQGIANTPRQEPLMRRVAASTDWKANPQLYAMQLAADQKFKAGPQQAPQTQQPQGLLGTGLNALQGKFQNMVSEEPGFDTMRNAPGVGAIRAQFAADPEGFIKALGITTNDPQSMAKLKAALGYA